jgi:hypothetical protein
MRDNVGHYIRKNEAARIPERYIILDAEAHRTRTKNGEVQSWALACTSYLSWTKNGTISRQNCRYEDPITLWQAVSSFTRPKRRTVLYAHNLNYDLRISQALTYLPLNGWTLRDMRLDGRGSWSRWVKDQRSLLLCDSASIFPLPLAQLATAIGMVKPPLPPSSAKERLFQRCEADVAILTQAMVYYIQWLRSGVAGNWQMTGAGQSWAHFRHSHMTEQILVHQDSDAIAAERAAMHTGRAEAWQWGKINKEKLWEYDWSNSYPRIAAETDLPARFFGTVHTCSPERLSSLARKYAVLADVSVSVASPCVPASQGGRTIWPTGSFRTVLWNPELQLVNDTGRITEVHKVWLYHKAPVLKDWAQWILSQLGSHDEHVPVWLTIILKHWSRALIGRFGMRYRQWQYFATAPTSRIYTSELFNAESGKKSELMQVGKDVFTLGELTETNDACPQITSYIMSEQRAKLWRVISQVGCDNVAYMDTDSLVVNINGHHTISSANQVGDYAGLRTKNEYRSAHIYGPRSAVFAHRPTVAGMPKRPTRIAPHTWSGEVWRGCEESIRRGEHDVVAITARAFTLRYNTNRRAFLDGGGTAPYSLPEHKPDNKARTTPRSGHRSILNDYPAVRALAKAARGRPRPVQRV